MWLYASFINSDTYSLSIVAALRLFDAVIFVVFFFAVVRSDDSSGVFRDFFFGRGLGGEGSVGW